MNDMEFEFELLRHSLILKDSMAAPFSFEMEELIMKKATENKNNLSLRKTVAVIAVAACFLLGSTAFASGVLTGWFSAAEKEYASLPSEDEYVQDIGYEPVLIEEFSNGYRYKTGYVVDNQHANSKTGQLEEFKSATFEYEKDGNLVLFSQEKYDSAVNSGSIVDSFTGIDLYYKSYMNKIVPEDYQMTEADKEAEAKGELVFSWGSDRVMTMEVKSLTWIKDGIQFMLLQMDGDLSCEDMVSMAKEAIAK